MKKLISISLIGLAVSALFSCSENSFPDTDISGNDTRLQLKSVGIYSNGRASQSGTIDQFFRGDTIGLLLCEYRYGNSLQFAARQYDWWQLFESVFLNDEPVRLLAYYPYRHNEHAFLSAKEVEVEQISQTDYMHGRDINENISRENPYADIEMRHVLALIEFRLNKKEYPDRCILSRISVQNRSGVKHLPDRGMLNLESGIVDQTGGYDQGAAITPENVNFQESYNGKETSILVMPIDPVRNHGDIFFEFVIDGRVYTWPVERETCWQSGMKYTYEVEMVPMTRSLKSASESGNINVVLKQAVTNGK